MLSKELRELVDSPTYKNLASRRRRMSYSLTSINIAFYLIYILSMGYARDWMSSPVGAGAINVGLLFAIFLIIFAAVLSGFYMWWTNSRYDPALKELLDNYNSKAANS